MNLIRKFAREISVFGLVIIIFLGLFAYRQFTFKNYKTVSASKVTSMVEQEDDFIIVLGDSTDTTVMAFQDVMAEYTTKNRSTDIYFMDLSKLDDVDDYVSETFDLSTTYPITLIIEDGQVKAKKQGAIEYYYFKDFIDENK